MSRGRVMIGLIMGVMALVSYFSYREVNPITGEKQHIGISRDQEVALGLQAAPEMAAQFGGLDPRERVQSLVQAVGTRVAERSAAASSDYRFSFHVLRDQETINAFALPGGPIFITAALLHKLGNEAQLAGVLGHEMGHVVARHSAEHLAKSQFAQLLVQAVGVAASDNEHPGRGQQAAAAAGLVSQMATLRYGRNDEMESDDLGVRFMSEAKYDPRSLIEVMDILAASSGGSRRPEFLNTHPDPGNRAERIRAAIAQRFPSGVPADFTLGQPMQAQ